MALTQSQCFFLLALIAAARGYYRGWGREIITCAVTLGGVLFLTAGGGVGLVHFVTVTLPDIVQGIVPPAFDPTVAPSNPVMDVLLVAGLSVLAHIVGTHFGAPPKTAANRAGGMAAGAVTGLALMYFLTERVLPATTFQMTSPSSTMVTTYMIGLLGIGLMVLLIIALVRK
ncbi:MAG TPA: hypothetical protein VFQ25_07470 [Ktedonobacterales bacterium]|nr:hypothetical protein [Ktedonobacterales bacterium]